MELESKVQSKPDDIDTRVALLQYYADTAPWSPGNDPGRRIRRLQSILYLVDHHPDAAASGLPLAFVGRSHGPYANEGDRLMLRTHWLAAVDIHRDNPRVVVNAVRFLAVEDKRDAEDVLRRAMMTLPDNREIAAQLGFLYAAEILDPDSRARASAALEQISNPFVLAAAGTAIPNLAMRAGGGRPVDETLFELASRLSSKARGLAPNDPEIQGPMPMIGYIAGARELPLSHTLPMPSSGIRMGEKDRAAKLVRRTEPEYPELARNAGIKGSVKLNAVIARDGAIQSLQVISGHPLLVPAALNAVKTWVYEPTLLNGVPVEVSTAITVSW